MKIISEVHRIETEIDPKINLVDTGSKKLIKVATMLQLQPLKVTPTPQNDILISYQTNCKNNWNQNQIVMITKLEFQISIKNYRKEYVNVAFSLTDLLHNEIEVCSSLINLFDNFGQLQLQLYKILNLVIQNQKLQVILKSLSKNNYIIMLNRFCPLSENPLLALVLTENIKLGGMSTKIK